MRCGKVSAAKSEGIEVNHFEQSMAAKLDQILKQMSSHQAFTEDVLRHVEGKLASVEQGQRELKGMLQAPKHTPRSARATASTPAAGQLNTNPTPLTDLKAILSSERDHQKAMEAVPLLAAETDGQKGNERRGSKDRKESKTTSVMLEGMEGLTFQEKLAKAQSALNMEKAPRSWLAKAVTEFLEDPESSTAAAYYGKGMTLFTLFAIFIALLPVMNIRIPDPYADILDIIIDAILCGEIVIRFTFYPSYTAFFTDAHHFENLIDFMSSVPLIILVLKDKFGEHIGSFGESFLLVAVPMIRLLRMIRRFTHIQLLKAAFSDCLEALPVLLYIMAVMAYGFMSLLYLVEPRENLPFMSDAGWLVLSTMTTVGFGDVVPATEYGVLITSVLMVVSSLYMAMPFGIIGYSFTKIWGNRSQILLLQGTRSRLEKWGFGAYEIPRLFALFDLDESAEIDLEEFHILLREMEIGFKEDDITDLFKTIDKDSGGTIDEKEFVKTLYPNEYRYMYAKRKE